MELGLRDRAAIVTGASRGIGRQIAIDLAAEGASVLLVARDAAALDDVSTEVIRSGGRAEPFVCDVGDQDAAERIVTECQRVFGRLDILINNAGGGPAKRLDTLSDADWREGFEVNFFAAARLALAAAQVMRERGWGRIVNVSSVYGRQPDPLFGPYSAAKAALLNLSVNLARAYSADGVLTNAVVPGVTLTELVEANAAGAAIATGRTLEEVMAAMLAKHPVAAGRFGQPEEISAAVVFLASERAAWITGAALAIDGGTR